MNPIRMKRVFVKPDECMCHSLCVSEVSKGFVEIEQLMSENIEITVAVVKENAVPKTKKALLELLNADGVCPMDAFRVELSDGRIFPVSHPMIQREIQSDNVEWM